MNKLLISVVVITKNEEDNIEDCLASVAGWADELIVVDDESADRTVELARKFTDRIFHRKMENEGRHRNWAYAQAKNDWVLSLDADERVTPELQREINEAIPTAGCAAFAIPLRNYIGTYWVRYAGWYPASKIRLFQKNLFRYEEAEVHPCAIVDGKTGSLTKDIIHKGYPDFEHFLASLNRQSTWEAKKWIRTGLNMTRGRIMRRSVDRFFRSYIGKRGMKDGLVGFMVALFAGLYQVVSYAKYWEMKRQATGQDVDHSK
ncbi:MAG: glycosyltransferase family 2 protein [Candidatus Omnitrophota bacterium]|nr:glycosyltransferase family 2 protein [Candidatus Omnitrophota bacterium]MDZ4241855.1 glycosyltransferase family 2 protein [Candidatus Omnitrophota bacterium]